MWLVGAVLLGVLVVAGALLFPRLLARPERVSVPNVRGLDIAVARSRLAEAGLLLETGDRRFSSTVPAGGVIGQDPGPGATVARRSVVTVVLSAGSEEFLMPDVIGMPVEEARRGLEERGLTVTLESLPSEEPSGTVLATLPAPGAPVRTSDEVRVSVAASRTASSVLLPYKLAGTCFVIDVEPMPPVSGLATAPPDAPLEVARRLRSLLEASGAGVSMTRSLTDTAGAVTPERRAARAAGATCTAIVGLTVSESAPGIAVLTLTPRTDDPRLYIPSTELARKTVESFRASKMTAGSVTIASDPVLASVSVPGIRVRLGSAASPADRSAFRDPTWSDRVARALYSALGEALAP